jgi:cell division protein FtsZ
MNSITDKDINNKSPFEQMKAEENTNSKGSFESFKSSHRDQRIAVIALGGAGGNALTDIMSRPELVGATNVDYYAANTDFAALSKVQDNLNMKDTNHLVLLGPKITGGNGAGGDPEVGFAAATESSKEIQDILQNYNIVFLAAGLGGGTGSSSIVVISDILRSLDILTIGVVNTPFKVEGPRRNKIAQDAITKLESLIDTLIVVPNDQIKIAADIHDNKTMTLSDAFTMANNVLALAVSSIITLTMETGFINIDAQDLVATCSRMGLGVIASSKCSGALRAKDALTNAINNPLLAPYELDKVGGIIVNIATDDNVSLDEFEMVANMLNKYMNNDSKVTIGTSNDPRLGQEEMNITLILTGIHKNELDKELAKDLNSNKAEDALFKGNFKGSSKFKL